MPRGIVTATTVPKGSNMTTSVIPLPSSKPPPSSSSVTPTPTNTTGTNTSGGGLLAKLGGMAAKPVPKPAAPTGRGGGGGSVVAPDVPVLPLGGQGGGVVSPSLLTSQLLEAHNLLQQQGTTLANNIHAPSAELAVVQEGSESVAASNHTMQSLGISPELLAQVSSFLNFPAVMTTATPSAVTPVPPPSSSSSAGNKPSLSQGACVHAYICTHATCVII